MARNERGAIAIWAVLLVGILLAISAVVLNTGHKASVKGELQNAVDAAALAGALQLNGTVDQITPAGNSATETATQDFASYHYTDKAGASAVATDSGGIILGQWRPSVWAGCDSRDTPTTYHDSAGSHFCQVAARDADAAFRINAVYARARRATGSPGGGPVPVWMGALLGLGAGATVNQGAEAIAITGGPVQSTCLDLPLVIELGCLAGLGSTGSPCPDDAPPDSPGPMYSIGLAPSPIRSAGWTIFSDANPTKPTVCNLLATPIGTCSGVDLPPYISVDTGHNNFLNSNCPGGLTVCELFQRFVGQTVEVPTIVKVNAPPPAASDDCTGPSYYTTPELVAGYATLRVLAVNCQGPVKTCVSWVSGTTNPIQTSSAGYCTTGPLASYASNYWVLTQLVCNHRGDGGGTGGAWTGTSTYHPVLVQTRGASN